MNEKINKLLTYVIILMVFFAIIILIFSGREGNKCMSAPFTYGAEKVSETDAESIMCSCSFANPKYEAFSFNEEGMISIEDSLELKGGNSEND